MPIEEEFKEIKRIQKRKRELAKRKDQRYNQNLKQTKLK